MAVDPESLQFLDGRGQNVLGGAGARNLSSGSTALT